MEKLNSHKIDDVFLRYASDILADTNTGLTGSKIIKFCNGYAIEYNVNIPITTPQFSDLVPNKRTALYKNLVEFNGYQQFKIIKELCEIDELSNNENVQKLKTQLYERFSRFNKLVNNSEELMSKQTTDAFAEVIKVLLDMYNNDDEMYVDDCDKRFSHIDNYEKVLKKMKTQGYLTKLRSDVLGGYEVELSEKSFAYAKSNENVTVSENNEPIKKLKTVFISYNHESSNFVDDMEKALSGECEIKRDKKNIKDWESITNFMKEIRNVDFAVLIITDKYLKSKACLYEVIQLMKNEDWYRHTMYVVMEDAQGIYDVAKQLEYVNYWKK